MRSMAVKFAVVSVVVTLGLLAVTVPAQADHTTPVLSIPAEAAVGEKIEVTALVSTAQAASSGQATQSQALPGKTLTFYTTESFGGVTGKVEIGRAVTDATGVASIRHQPRATGDHQISVEYLVEGEGPAGAAAVISVAGVGTTQLYHSNSGIEIPGLNVWVLIALLSTVWAILLSVALRVVVIAHAGSATGTSRGPSMVGAR